jgi:prophage regulatory protein
VGETLLRLPEVMRRTALSRAAIYRGMRTGTFPLSLPTGARTVAWIEAEVDEYIARQIANREAARAAAKLPPGAQANIERARQRREAALAKSPQRDAPASAPAMKD